MTKDKGFHFCYHANYFSAAFETYLKALKEEARKSVFKTPTLAFPVSLGGPRWPGRFQLAFYLM